MGRSSTERRKRIHAAVAAALLEGDAEGSGEQAAVIAHHWQEAGEAALAARWHWRAAEWAAYRDPLDALRRWRLILDLLDGLDETTETVELGVMARARLLRLGARMATVERRPARAVRVRAERSRNAAPTRSSSRGSSGRTGRATTWRVSSATRAPTSREAFASPTRSATPALSLGVPGRFRQSSRW